MMQAHEIQCSKNQGGTACECDCYLSRLPKGTLTTWPAPAPAPSPASLDLEGIERFLSLKKWELSDAEEFLEKTAWDLIAEIRRLRVERESEGVKLIVANEEIQHLAQRIIDLQAMKAERESPKAPNMCEWVEEDPDADMWKSQCGQEFVTIGGSPKENGMYYCCHCGGMLYEGEIIPEPDDDEDEDEPQPTPTNGEQP